jgi:hypothetical protein
MSDAGEDAGRSKMTGPLIGFCTVGAIIFAQTLGELAGAAFLPEQLAEYGPLLVASLLVCTAGYALGWSPWTLITAVAIAMTNWRLHARDGDVSEWALQSVIMLGAFGLGLVLAKALPAWRSI